MEEYYECRHSFHLEKTKAPRCYLQYKSLFGPEQEIPLILVNDDGNIFEFFTKTKFISEKNGYFKPKRFAQNAQKISRLDAKLHQDGWQKS